jgi:[ribosomal protein S5]-alanine N-acetyltransferase
MAFLGRDDEPWRRVDGVGVVLRHPEAKFYSEWAELRAASRAFLTPWEPVWGPDDLSREAFRARLRRYSDDVREGRAYPFYVFSAEDGALVGGATLSRVHRGAAQSCTLGYWVGEAHKRRGYTLKAVRALIGFAFHGLDLHRVEAACVPENSPSKALLEKAGFTQEGYARGYLRINGAWRDHHLFGLVRTDHAGHVGS